VIFRNSAYKLIDAIAEGEEGVLLEIKWVKRGVKSSDSSSTKGKKRKDLITSIGSHYPSDWSY
jgi:hypothetical protein